VPFDTLLVANRGEIACRIMRSAAALGLRTVAVYSEADRGAPHVEMADAAIWIGPTPARESYLRIDRILDAAAASGAGAVHPGYGLLSEDPAAAEAIEAAGLTFVGPTVAQLRALGAKDEARRFAETVGLPLLPASETVTTPQAALAAGEALGYPVILKAVGGGGGMGLRVCPTAEDLEAAWPGVRRVIDAGMAGSGAYLERFVAPARHVEVQIFGAGDGRVVTLGDRDCTLQRRHQKVVEEAPAPRLAPGVRQAIATWARQLGAAVDYRSAGTVEYLYDVARGEPYFLEVNPRLQVEHTVTEAVHDVDLVDWMLRLALGDADMLDAPPRAARGHAVQARVYAENAAGEPSAGLLTDVVLPPDVRVETWVATGQEVTAAYDPLLAKIVVHGPDRDAALRATSAALAATRIAGIQTNLGVLRAAVQRPDVRRVEHTTATLAEVRDAGRHVEVLRAGLETTVQDWPGRLGRWRVGVPPSGPMDDRSFRHGNALVGNPEGASGLECLLGGPRLRFSHETVVCVCGAPCSVLIDGRSAAQWEPIVVPAAGTLDVGEVGELGMRVYVLIAGGLDVPKYLGSRATFTLGGFGGHGGRPLRDGDVLPLGVTPLDGRPSPTVQRPGFAHDWTLEVLEGPHAAPDFFTAASIEAFYDGRWEVHFNSARTGVRLVGPSPEWARSDGGEAGLHPSNIHDTPYAVGTVDYTGDTPIILGPDGPSLGGFVCPATVLSDERWKLGQLRPGDTVRFAPTIPGPKSARRRLRPGDAPLTQGVLRRDGEDEWSQVTFRRSGDDHLLIEFGPMEIDLGLRLKVHALGEAIVAEEVAGITDLTPGIRSLQVQLDPKRRSVESMAEIAAALVPQLPAVEAMRVPSRRVYLPLSWDDPQARLAVERYMSGVRSDAPWCPSNIEFIRRVNGLADADEVRRIVFEGDYLVMGLGDVYLGAPVTVPLDPRHRLVTTKYNPARTWTPENAVGIGGAYLAIYGMEGPGGYQLIGRTVQVWNHYARGPAFRDRLPWLLRMFDRIQWLPVSAEELVELRADMAAGRGEVAIEDGVFDAAEHLAFLDRERAGAAAFGDTQRAAFAAERAAWQAAGEFDGRASRPADHAVADLVALPAGTVIPAPLASSVWRIHVAAGDRVVAGEELVTLEAMKMEMPVEAPHDGEVVAVLVQPGATVASGAGVVVVAGEP